MKSSMQATIPPDIRAQFESDPRMKRCCVADEKCIGRIEWHHAMTFSGRRLQYQWTFVGICQYHHHHEAGCADRILLVCLNLASDEQLARISKAIDYRELRDRLNKNYYV